MNYKIVLISLLLFTLIFNACKNSNEYDSAKDKVDLDIGIEVNPSDPDLLDARSRAEEKLIGINKEGLFNSLITDYWHYDVVVKGTGPVDDFKGYWLKFNEDQTYLQGLYDKELVKGKWNYNPDTERLTMLPDNKDGMPSEFTLMPKPKTIICVGTPDFRNNDTQMKLVQVTGFPVFE